MCGDERYIQALQEEWARRSTRGGGLLDRALKSKHYNRELRCLRLMYEALMSQLVKGMLTPDLADETRENLQILRNTSLSQESRVDAHAALEQDADIESLITNIFTQTEASDMADYWRDFLSMTDTLMQNVHAVHGWMVAYDNSSYGRWLLDFGAMLTALPVDQVAYLRTDFTRSITGNPTPRWPGTCGSSVSWTRAAHWSLAGSPSSRMRSSCWSTLEMWTMWPGSGRLKTSWPIEKMPRGSTWNAAQKGCEKISSACRTWSHAWTNSIPSLSTRPHPPLHPTVSHAWMW